MTNHNIRRDDIEALFAGLPPAPGSGLDGVALLFSSLKAAARDDVPSGIEKRQLAAITRTIAEATGSEKQRRIRFRALFAPALVKVAALVMFVLVAGGALAATGNIPAYQDKVADALSFVVNLPGGSDEADEKHPPARDVQDGSDEPTEVNVIEQADVTSDGEQTSGSQETESSSGSRLDVEGSSGSGSQNQRSEGDAEGNTESPDESDEEELDDDGASGDMEIDD